MKTETRAVVMVAVVVAATLATGACSSVHHVGPAFSREAAHTIRHETGGPIDVVDPGDHSPQPARVRVVRVLPESTIVKSPTGLDLTIRNSDIKRVGVRNRPLGAIEGMGIGLLAGVATGVGIALAVGGSDQLRLATGGFAIIGVGLGALIGAGASHETTYLFGEAGAGPLREDEGGGPADRDSDGDGGPPPPP